MYMFNWQINGWILKEFFGESQAGGLEGSVPLWFIAFTQVCLSKWSTLKPSRMYNSPNKLFRGNRIMQRFLHKLSSKYGNWRPYFGSRARQLLSRLWKLLAIFSVLILALSALFNVLVLVNPSSEFSSPDVSEALGWLNRMFTLTAFVIVISVFGSCFVIFLILSLHPKGRKIADKIFNFIDITELEKLKVRVATIEKDMLSQNEKVDKELDDIRGRLGSIEATLKTLVSKESKE